MIPTCAGSGVAPLEAHQRAKSRQSDRGGRLLRLCVGYRAVDFGRGQAAGGRRVGGIRLCMGSDLPEQPSEPTGVDKPEAGDRA